MAIETHDTKTKASRYFWATAWVNTDAEEVGEPVVGRFLTSKIDYDGVGVVNSLGDSIYITLLRHKRGNGGQEIDGKIYVNNCPLSGSQGVLLPVTAGQ